MHLEITDTRTITDENPKRTKMEFHNTPISLGSASANTIQLPDTDVPQYHAMILPQGDEGDEWVIQPAVMTVPIYVNDAELTAPVQLEDGDVVRITYFEIKFTLDLPPELALPEPGNLEELAKIKQYPLPSRADVRKGDDDIRLTQNKQNLLANFGLKLRQCHDFASLIEVTLDLLLPELAARTVWMGLRRANSGPLEQVDGRSAEGKYTGEPWMLEGLMYRCMNRYQYIRLPKTGQPDTQSVIAVPITCRRGALGLIIADTKRRTRVFDEADLDLVTFVARLVGSQLEAIIDDVSMQKQQSAASQLTFLREVQSRLDPKNVPLWKGIQIAAYAKPGKVSSGDIYDITRLPNGLTTILMGHITSDNTSRIALAMAEVRTAFRTATLHADPPHVQLQVFNWFLHSDKEPCTMSAIVIVLNPKTGMAEYCCAGDLGALIVDSEGVHRVLAAPDIPPVGTARAVEYSAKKEQIDNGETLAFFTWGASKAQNAAGEPLGKSRFVDAICDGFGQSASAALDDLLVDLSAYLKEGTPQEDITILFLHRDVAKV